MSRRVVQRANARLWTALLSLAILVPALSSCSSDDPEMQAMAPLVVRQTSPAEGAEDIPLSGHRGWTVCGQLLPHRKP